MARKVTSIGYNNGVAGILSSGRIYTYSDLGEETGAYDAGNDAKKILLYSNSQAYVLGSAKSGRCFFLTQGEFYLNYVLDAIVLVILIFFIYGGIRRGGVRSLIGLVCAVAAVWGASSLSTVISQGFYSAFFRELLTPAGERSPSRSGRRRPYRSGGKDFWSLCRGPFPLFLVKGGF